MKSGEGNHAPSPGTAARHRWWLDIRWITAGIVAMAIAFLLWGLFGPEAAIRISRETTCITEPLAADGLPDYRAALLAMAGPAPPPEENAAAALLQVCWPLGIDRADLPNVCAAIGIPNEPPSEPLRAPHKDATSKVTSEMFDAAQERPWTGENLPELEAWLQKNETKIDQLVAASLLPKFWYSMPVVHAPNASMWDSWTPFSLLEARRVTQILLCRAMWHIGEGRHRDAWHDVRAATRLGMLFVAPDGGPQFLVTQLVASAIQSTANKVLTIYLLADPDLPRDVLTEIGEDLDARGAPSSPRDTVVAERMFVLDMLVFAARRASGGRHGRAETLGEVLTGDSTLLIRTSLDWNSLLKCVNDNFDQIDAALQLRTHGERVAALERLDDTRVAAHRDRSEWSQRFMLFLSRGYRTAAVGESVTEDAFGVTIWTGPHVRTQALDDLARTAVALAEWRLDQRDEASMYPEQLDELVPQYLATIPLDPFSERPFIYERRGSGYLLASVGRNGLYDGGNDEDGEIVNGEWKEEKQLVKPDECDLVIRMPVPDRPFGLQTAP